MSGNRHHGGDQSGAEQHQGREDRPADRESLMRIELHTGQAHQQIGGWHQWAQQMHRLADQRCTPHLRRRDAVGLTGLRQNRQDAEVEGIVRDEEGERNAEHPRHDREIRPERIRYGAHHTHRHRIDHLRAGQDAGEDAGGKDQRGHGHGVGRMRGEQFLLLRDTRVVDHDGECEADHEQHRQRHQADHECRHQCGRQHGVHDQQLRATPVRVVDAATHRCVVIRA